MRLTTPFICCGFELAALLFGTGSCTVYAPMQPTMPLVAAVGQTEGSVSIQPNGRVEATAAYSPAPHVLLTAGGTVCPKLGTTTFLETRQYELGVGGYLPLSSLWLLSGMGGYGQAVSTRGYWDLPFYLGSTYSEYHARYSKLFAQVGVANVYPRHSFGLTYRLTQVRFATLTDTRLGELPLSTMLRHETLVFFRHEISSSGRWDAQATMGLSMSGTPRRNDDLGYPTYGAAEYQANRNLLPAFYASLGVVYRPKWGDR